MRNINGAAKVVSETEHVTVGYKEYLYRVIL